MAIQSHFFAFLARMKLIQRWPLMRNQLSENVQEHSLQVAQVAHCLAELHNRQHGGNIDCGQVVLHALYHDASEVLTGDLPTPVKYANKAIANQYKQLERAAEKQLVAMLPTELASAFAPYIDSSQVDETLNRFVKAADTLCAYVKCLEERAAGNKEFALAEEHLKQRLDALDMPEVNTFLTQFAPSFALTLDELSE